MNTDNANPSTNPPQNTVSAGNTVIQPSASFVEEMKATAAQPTPAAQQPPTQPSPAPTPQQQPPTSTPSIYPEATKGFGTAPPAATLATTPTPAYGQTTTSSAGTTPTPTKNSTKVTAVRAVAAAILFLSAINLYDWILELHAGYTNFISLLEIAAIIALAIGIFKLSEFARSAYVIISAISLVLSCIGFITFYASTHRNTAAPTYNATAAKAQLETTLHDTENDPSLSAQAKQTDITNIQREINDVSANKSGGSAANADTKQYISTGVLVITAVGPLVFLTRPSIKEVFN